MALLIDSLVRLRRETAMKNRMRKTRFMALVLSVMLVVTTIFSGVTVYADNLSLIHISYCGTDFIIWNFAQNVKPLKLVLT